VTAVPPLRSLTAGLIVLAVGAAGCGSSSSDTTSSAPPPARAADFPKPAGRTIAQLAKANPQGPVLVPSVSSAYTGSNRLGFGLFTREQKQINGAVVAVYTADGKGGNVKGPYPARFESLAVKPQFRSQTTAADPDAAKGVYVADVPFARNGPVTILGLARVGGKLMTAGELSVDVGAQGAKGPPRVGDKAILIHTPTLASVGGDAAKVDTRIPPAKELSQTDFASVVGRKPVVLLFATPALCKSRVCGPVEDIAAQVAAQYGGRVTFIHQEIYNDNKVEKGFRPQVGKWRLPSEPWAFAIDRNGKIVDRLEGAFSAGELARAAQKALNG
jgi:opacity protein-like surface antigen